METPPPTPFPPFPLLPFTRLYFLTRLHHPQCPCSRHTVRTSRASFTSKHISHMFPSSNSTSLHLAADTSTQIQTATSATWTTRGSGTTTTGTTAPATATASTATLAATTAPAATARSITTDVGGTLGEGGGVGPLGPFPLPPPGMLTATSKS